MPPGVDFQSRRRLMPASRTTARLALWIGLGVLLSPGPADAIEGGPEWYTYGKGTNCKPGAEVDPINVVFYGRDATQRRTDAFVKSYMGWEDASEDSENEAFRSKTQGFLTPRCRRASYQRADGESDESRNHVRLRERDPKRGERRHFTVGDAHLEDYVGGINPTTGCGVGGGHAVKKGSVEDPTENGSGFDQGRKVLTDRWEARGRSVSYRIQDNTHPFKQCDGDEAGSDGYVAYMTIPKRR